MRNKLPLLESPESASPTVTRAVAAGLRDEFIENYPFKPWEKIALQALGIFPQRFARLALTRAQAFAALDPVRLTALSAEDLALARAQDYRRLEGKFPVVTVGAPLGGAAAHLSLALGGPFLPQAFVMTLKGGSPSGDALTYFQRSADLAQDIAQRNPGIMTIQHYDPIHDGWVTRYANHLRPKLIRLPEAYAAFLRERLEPGGTVCYLECGARWLSYRLGERSVFQVGGWGGIPAQEFLDGSGRIRQYCQEAGFSSSDWRLPGFTVEERPESEWGSEPGLGESLQAYSQAEGFRFVRIQLPGPFDYARLAYDAMLQSLREEDREPGGVLVEMFSNFDATAVRRSGLLPLWLVFNTRDSLAFLQEMRNEFPRELPIFFAPIATFSSPPDIARWRDWEEALQGLTWYNLGPRPGHYPADPRALLNWARPLREWVHTHERPVMTKLNPEALVALSKRNMTNAKLSTIL